MNIKQLAHQYEDFIISQRRRLHQCPELSFHEVETTKLLAKELDAMGIPVTTFPDYTGLVGEIKGGKPGKTVLLRADIDALPMEEHANTEFASTNGNMHACGHDCHMAMLLGAAKILLDIREELQGAVRLLFQAGEETSYGAQYYVDHGVLEGVSAVFGMHIWGTFDAPFLSVEPGERMAGCDIFKLTVKGVSAHGSEPHLGNDAIVAASSIVLNLQALVSRMNNPLDTVVLTIGTINGGQRFNILADQVELEGTVRSYRKEGRQWFEDTMRRIAENSARALGCEATLEYKYSLDPVINSDPYLNQIAGNAAIKLFGEEGLAPMPKLTSSEDFSRLTKNIPGFFAFLGCRNPAIGAQYPNHSDKFLVDESVLYRGAALYAQFAHDFLSGETK